ncbi:type-F conjugative transfer system protein TrbI [Legionella sp. PATHC038]|uniref:TrbI F-type domain-containing protein n=1 Tax=Legionella sheltonii TaxID=2992041 RepID=UPI0022445B74|nr:TrbI F-type domain-containing protein [Legionella sp. PATHC038]MCW8400501.1 type-F conjugative transfer system protein TrbI [Legionella sp. PATHC038]
MVLNQWDLKYRIALGALAVLGLLLCLLAFAHKHSSLVVIDMTRVIQKPSMMLARSKLTEQEQLKIMRRFSALLPEVIKAYGVSHQVTVISSPVLFSQNTQDATDEIVAQTISRMKHEQY